MQCPSCAKPFAAELSICPGCGAMTTLYNHVDNKPKLIRTDSVATGLNTATETAQVTVETRFMKKDSTSTLLEFPANRSKTTEWREEIKNRVREREDRRSIENGANDDFSTAQTPELSQSKSAVVISIAPKLENESVVTRALRRLEVSRKTFAEDTVDETPLTDDAKTQPKTAERETILTIVPPRTPRKVTSVIEDDLYSHFENDFEAIHSSVNPNDDNDLQAETFHHKPFESSGTALIDKPAPRKIVANLEDDYPEFTTESINETTETVSRSPRKTFETMEQTPAPRVRQTSPRQKQTERTEDFAPLSSRFIAGIIDFVLTAILTAIILAGFGFPSRDHSTVFSFFSVFAVFSVVSIIYFTAAIMLANKTIGSAFFGLKTVCVEDGTSPNLLQSILNGSICVLSLAFIGLGFLTIFLNSEKRALHDLVSGTVTVQE